MPEALLWVLRVCLSRGFGICVEARILSPQVTHARCVPSNNEEAIGFSRYECVNNSSNVIILILVDIVVSFCANAVVLVLLPALLRVNN